MTDCTRTEEQLVDYLEGTLPPREHEAIESHAARCRACGAALRESRSILTAYRSVPDEDVRGEIAGKLLAAARLQPSASRARRRALTLAAAAAIALVIAAVSVLWFERGAPGETLADLLREAAAHRAAGETQAELATYEKALGVAGEDERAAEILHRLGELHIADEDFARALERIDPLIATHPDYANLEAVFLLRGRALEGLGRREQALELYRMLAAEFPSSRDEALRKLETLARPEQAGLETLRALGYGGD